MKKEDFKPEYGHIPQIVLERIREEVNKIGYDSIFVLRRSLNPYDNYTYVVIAKKKDKEEYAFWSCYNDCFQSLNHGHYGYTDFDKCFEDALKFVEN